MPNTQSWNTAQPPGRFWVFFYYGGTPTRLVQNVLHFFLSLLFLSLNIYPFVFSAFLYSIDALTEVKSVFHPILIGNIVQHWKSWLLLRLKNSPCFFSPLFIILIKAFKTDWPILFGNIVQHWKSWLLLRLKNSPCFFFSLVIILIQAYMTDWPTDGRTQKQIDRQKYSIRHY